MVVEIEDFIKIVSGPLLGFLGAVAVFRSRFVAIEKDIEAMRQLNESDRKHDREVFTSAITEIRSQLAKDGEKNEAFQKRMERRQKVSLEIIASLAHKLGADHRAIGTDRLVQILAQDENDNGESL